MSAQSEMLLEHVAGDGGAIEGGAFVGLRQRQGILDRGGERGRVEILLGQADREAAHRHERGAARLLGCGALGDPSRSAQSEMLLEHVAGDGGAIEGGAFVGLRQRQGILDRGGERGRVEILLGQADREAATAMNAARRVCSVSPPSANGTRTARQRAARMSATVL